MHNFKTSGVRLRPKTYAYVTVRHTSHGQLCNLILKKKITATEVQWIFFAEISLRPSRLFVILTMKIVYFYYKKKYFLDQSIQKIFYLILKKEALENSHQHLERTGQAYHNKKSAQYYRFLRKVLHRSGMVKVCWSWRPVAPKYGVRLNNYRFCAVDLF